MFARTAETSSAGIWVRPWSWRAWWAPRLPSHRQIEKLGSALRPHEHPDAADLLRTEHAAVRVLASAESEVEAYPALLAAIGTSLGCAGSLWLADGEDLWCAHTWPSDAAAGAELVAGVWESQ